jgi:predicted AlkP superfamily pyrophosphatase or phosphodiesterase
MKLRALLLAALILWATALGAQTPPTVRRVIIVSVDGLMPATYVSPEAHGLKIPTLREIVRHGAWSEGARSVFPTVTYPAHASIATGTNPARHGIVSNLAWDPLYKNQTGWRWYAEDVRMPALWDGVQARDLTSALVWWPATVGARASVVVPEIWRAGNDEDKKLLRALSTPGVLETVAARFANFSAGFTPPAVKDEALTDIAVHLIDTRRPHLLMLHLPQVDHAQHTSGLFSAAAIAALENADRQIARVIEAAKNANTWNETALIVVSDHGFARISRSVKPGVLLAKKGLVALDSRGRVTSWKAIVAGSGGYLYVYLKEPNDVETQKALLELLLPLENNRESGIRRVYKREEIRAKGGDPTAFLALEGADGFELADGYRGSYLSPAAFAATHGYDPERPEMLASLLVYGPAIAPGKIARARLIDVAPTVAHWLDLKLDQAEGTALPIKLRAPER